MSLLEKTGILRVHGASTAINTETSPNEAGFKARAMNSADYLLKTFFDPENDMLPDGVKSPTGSSLVTVNSTEGTVKLFIPSSPYSELAMMVIAGNEAWLREQGSSMVRTHTVYSMGPEVSFHYWKIAIQSLQVFRAHLPEGSHDLMIGQNNLPYFTGEIKITTDEDIRTSKSISLDHAHIIPVPKNAIDTTRQVSLPHLDVERAALRAPGFAEFVTCVANALPEGTRNLLYDFDVHEEAPVGYTFTFPGNMGIELFSQCLKDHHDAFTRVSPRLPRFFPDDLRGLRTLPMPSYRFYATLTAENDIQCYVSPEVLSFAGVMEAAGVGLLRSPEVPIQLDTEQTIKYRTLLWDTLRKRN